MRIGPAWATHGDGVRAEFRRNHYESIADADPPRSTLAGDPPGIAGTLPVGLLANAGDDGAQVA